MLPGEIKVPAALLGCRNLAPSAKIVWICHQWGAIEASGELITFLQAWSGLETRTIARGLSQLQLGGWLTESLDATGSHACVPTDLLADGDLGTSAKLMYGALQLMPRATGRTRKGTYGLLAAAAGLSVNTVKEAVQELQHAGWVTVSRKQRLGPIDFTLHNPIHAARQRSTKDISRRIAMTKDKGEAIMREYLNLLVDRDDYRDNSRPDFLRNPYTGEAMEFDRYYPPDVAFEFQGAQHDGPTDLYPSEKEAREQLGRDLIKLAISMKRGIKLVAVYGKDLSLEAMRAMIPAGLPLRDLGGAETVIHYLEVAAEGYRRQSPT